MKSSNNTEKTLEAHKTLINKMSVTQIQIQIRDRSKKVKDISELVDFYNKEVRRMSFAMMRKNIPEHLKKEAGADFRRTLKYLRQWIERLKLESLIITAAYMALAEKQISHAK